ncbi:hypothetical protein BV378_26010 [Nostoc sp. RF31YmG]|nr:hypothetical protein BV378_26010 [Nostoc sp. RF31YmG]
MFTRQAGYYFDWIQLIESELNIFPGLTEDIRNKLDSEEDKKLLHDLDKYINTGDNIFIVHHPKGKQKKIDISNNKVIENGLYKNFLRYKVDSDYGSSGGLIVNSNWEAVALHHAAVPKDYNQENDLEHKVEIVAQQGIRICRIVEDLKKKSFRYRKVRNFIEDFVITSEQLNNPPLAFAIELDGFNDYVLLKNFVDCQFITQPQFINGFSIEALMCPYSNEVESTIFSKFYQNFCNDCIATLGYDALRVYINKEGKIVFSRKMYTLPTLPLEVPQEESKQQEFIFNLQSILKILSYSVVINGVYDDDTKRELQEFVKNIKYNFDIPKDISEINPQILNYLNSQITFLGLYDLNYDALEQISYENKELKIPVSENPSKGEIVKGLQKLLKSFGFYNYPLNGVYNKETCNAVKKFQEAFGLKQDGVCGPLTQKMITLIQSYEYETEEVVNFGEFNQITITCKKEHEELKIDIQINRKSSNLQLCQKSTNQNLQKIQEKIRNSEINVDITQGSPVIIGAYSNKNLAIPDFPCKGNLWSFFRGAIAKVRLWNIVSDKNSLIGDWQFEEGKNDKLYSLVSQDTTQGSTICGKPKWLRQSNFPAPLLPSALKLDDKNSYVNCGYDQSLDVIDAITVEAWFKHKFGNCSIVSLVDSEKNGYSLSWYNGKILVALQQYRSSKTIVYTKENAPQDQVWHHIAFTWDQKSQEISIYIDGRIQDCVVEGESKTIIFAGKAKSIGLFTGPLPQVAESLTIGCKSEKEIYYSVAIADVRLWKVARTQDDIKANMSQRLSLRSIRQEINSNEKILLGYWRLDDDKDVRNLVNNKPGRIIGEATCFPSPAISPPQTAEVAPEN